MGANNDRSHDPGSSIVGCSTKGRIQDDVSFAHCPNNNSFEIDSDNLVAVAKVLGVQVHILRAGTAAEVGSALEAIAKRRLGPVVIGPSPFFNTQGKELGALMVRHVLPAIFQTREFVASGGLMSYGGSLLDVFRIAGSYTARILKGEKPANLPVQQIHRAPMCVGAESP